MAYEMNITNSSEALAASYVRGFSSSMLLPGWRLWGFTTNRARLDQVLTQANFPLVAIVPDPSNQWVTPSGQSFSELGQTTLTPIDPSGTNPPQTSCNVFTSISDLYSSFLSGFLDKNQGSRAILDLFQDPTQVDADYFAKSQMLVLCFAEFKTYNLAEQGGVTPNTTAFAGMVFNSLPTEYDNSTAGYFNYILDQVGTDYISSANLGGMLVLTLSPAQCVGYAMSTSNIQAQANAVLNNLLEGAQWDSGLDSLFADNTPDPTSGGQSSGFQFVYGGDPSKLSGKGTAMWQQTVPNAPSLVSWTMTSIADLIPSSFGLDLIAAFKQAAEVFVADATATRNALVDKMAAAEQARLLGAQPMGTATYSLAFQANSLQTTTHPDNDGSGEACQPVPIQFPSATLVENRSIAAGGSHQSGETPEWDLYVYNCIFPATLAARLLPDWIPEPACARDDQGALVASWPFRQGQTWKFHDELAFTAVSVSTGQPASMGQCSTATATVSGATDLPAPIPNAEPWDMTVSLTCCLDMPVRLAGLTPESVPCGFQQ
jgi:hypothetical protein